ncbi:MAG: L,D-transpeptidase [Algibacter sp.]|uniref:L,D-transpeptidase n=1 Tax=Algibacter sp. TaxID=1872428 RepID=UPI002612FD59|nr:L,D-transpeptidase [Algibacter sp.]MDG1730346.1 L,D-transpeptidase [Algibacter sp.]MDG2178824.1 L,D-transpeptidase [Algibacter sp.]
MKLVLKLKLALFALIPLIILLKFCCPKEGTYFASLNTWGSKTIRTNTLPIHIKISHDVIIENYFQFLDSITKTYDSLVPYKLSEHLLVRTNPWIIDTLQNTDYYRMKARDSFVYNQKKMIVLPKGAIITIPDSLKAIKLQNSFKNISIDVNIPEYKLRILKDSTELFEFPIRVGRDEKKYLKMAGRVLNLKTKTGSGIIVKHVRNPSYYNPVNGHQYFVTKRDDDKITKLPQIPFIETEINGLRNGQLIHPTTNPITLEKAYSNGCIGTKEADAWVIYYYAPIGTKIKIRYDLKVMDRNGKNLVLKDIYGLNKKIEH